MLMLRPSAVESMRADPSHPTLPGHDTASVIDAVRIGDCLGSSTQVGPRILRTEDGMRTLRPSPWQKGGGSTPRHFRGQMKCRSVHAVSTQIH